jgi:hypothetical protein
MKKYLVAATCLTLVAGAVFAKKLNNEQKRLEECGVVMQEVLNVPDNIPQGALGKGRVRHRDSVPLRNLHSV